MPPIPRLPEHEGNPKTFVSDYAFFGFELGKECALRLIRGYAVTPLQPDLSQLDVLALFSKIAEDFVAAIAEPHLEAEEAYRAEAEKAYRAGFQRGLEVQL